MSSERPIEVVVVEDHAALSHALELLLAREGFSISGVAGDAGQGYGLVRVARPDVAIIDIGLPGETGVELTRRLLGEDPELGVLLYTGTEDLDLLREALDCGARGFAFKAGAPEELRSAIRAVAAGATYVDPRVRSTILSRSTTERVGMLSAREREVLDQLAQGRTGQAIAQRLNLSPETVRTHVRNAMEKLEAQTRVHAIAIALRQGEIELGDGA